MQDMREEARLLEEVRIRVENAIRATADLILHIVNECLRRRLSRIGIDLTRDDVEEELQKERDMVLMAQQRLEEIVTQVRDQIGKDRAAKERLEREWSDKMEAFRIDDLNGRLRPGDPTLLNYHGVARFQEGSVIKMLLYSPNDFILSPFPSFETRLNLSDVPFFH